MPEHQCSLGDASPTRRNILVIGARGTGKTFFIQKWVSQAQKKPIVFHEKNNEWKGLDVETHPIGLLNRKSFLREHLQGCIVVVDDALNLTKSYADKLIGLASINRSLGTSFIVCLQGLGVLKERKDALGVFDTIIFFSGSESCAFLVKNTNRFSKEVELIRKEISKLGPHEILIYDGQTKSWYKTKNDDCELLGRLIERPLEGGHKLEKVPSKGSSKNIALENKKERIKVLIEKRVERREIIKSVSTSAGYLTKVLSELRAEGQNIPKAKSGRPRMVPDECNAKIAAGDVVV